MNEPLQDLTFHVRRYIDDVLSVPRLDIIDYPGGALAIDPKTKQPVEDSKGHRQMMLPLTRKTLAGMFGDEVVDRLTEHSHWALLVAILYHEMGHLISPEEFGGLPKEMFYQNVVHDCNETTVIPREWIGSGEYFTELYSLARALAKDGDILTQIDPSWAPDPAKPDELPKLQHFTPEDLPAGSAERAEAYREMLDNTYRIYRGILEFKWEGEFVDKFPDNHALHDVFEDTKQVISEARSYYDENPAVFRDKRNDMAKRFYDRVEDWWVNEMKQPKDTFDPEPPEQPGGGGQGSGQGGFSLGVGGGGGAMGMFDVDGGGAGLDQAMKDALEQHADNSDMNSTASTLDGLEQEKNMEEDKEQRKHDAQQDQAMEDDDRGEAFSDASSKGHGTAYSTPPKIGSHNINVDNNVVSSLARTLKILIQERKMAGRRSSKVGEKFHSSNFYQIKTDIKRAQIRTAVEEIKMGDSSTSIAMFFDRSGSMDGTDIQISKQVMASMYLATRTIKEITLDLFGFCTESDMVTPSKSKKGTLAQIDRVLSSSGGTDFPKAYKTGLDLLKRSKSKRKYLILLTDGDTERGSYSIKELYRWAKRQKIHVLIFGISGAPRNARDGLAYSDSYRFLDTSSRVPKAFSEMIKDVMRKR